MHIVHFIALLVEALLLMVYTRMRLSGTTTERAHGDTDIHHYGYRDFMKDCTFLTTRPTAPTIVSLSQAMHEVVAQISYEAPELEWQREACDDSSWWILKDSNDQVQVGGATVHWIANSSS